MADELIPVNIVMIYHRKKCTQERIDSINKTLLERMLKLQPQRFELTKSEVILWIDSKTPSEHIIELYRMDGVVEISMKKPDTCHPVCDNKALDYRRGSEWVYKTLVGNWRALSVPSLSKEISPSMLCEFKIMFDENDRVTICDCANSTDLKYSLSTSGLSPTLELEVDMGWTQSARMWSEQWQIEQSRILNEYIHRVARLKTIEFTLSKCGEILTLTFEGERCKFIKS